jgi:hypothetical protein
MPLCLGVALPGDLSSIEDASFCAYSPYVARTGRKPAPMTDNYEALMVSGRVHVIARNAGVLEMLVLVPKAKAMLLDTKAGETRATA